MVLGRRAVGHTYHQMKEAGVAYHGTMFEQEEKEVLASRNDSVTGESSTKRADHKPPGISDWEAGVSLAKAIMGAGSFALPWAFSQMGYLAGPLGLGILMGLSVYSLRLLLQCARTSGHHSYVEIARTTFGPWGARMAYAASISASLGVCGSYLVFIAANLHSMLEASAIAGLSQAGLILLVLPLAVLLSSVRDMAHFAFASLLGNISVVVGMVVVLIYGLLYNPIGKTDCVAVGSLTTMPLAFGAIGYLFLVHFLVLPIESAMATPDHFHSVATKTFVACAILCGSFGVIGYLLFGSETQQIVLLNVQGSFFVSAVKGLLCVDLVLTYPVVMRPSIVIVEHGLLPSDSFRQHSLPTATKRDWTNKRRPEPVGWATHMAVCGLLGLVAACGGIFVPAFGLLSGLVGGVSQTFLAFVLPPLMLAKQQHPQGVAGTSVKELSLVALGAVLILWTLVSTWQELGIAS